MNCMGHDNIVLTKSYDFAIRIVKMYQYLATDKKEYIISKQVVRSGTSIGANVEEAVGGLTKKDFSAKMNIAYKEARETRYWLRLLHDTGYLEKTIYESILKDCEELLKLLFSIIKTSRKSL
jgi:four helix bundle protein